MASLAVAMSGPVRGEPLDDSVPGQHAAIEGKAPAHHKGTHGCVLLGKDIRLVREVRLVFAAVHKDVAGVAAGVTVALVHGVAPSSATAEI